MADNTAAAAARGLSFFARIVPIMLGLIGLTFLSVGATFLSSQTWARTTATVQSCYAQPRAGAKPGDYTQSCQVTWVLDGQTHSGTVQLSGRPLGPTVDLRVKGDTVVEASPVWIGATAAGVGLVLVIVAVTMFIRARRRA
jgi:hypothetical protein